MIENVRKCNVDAMGLMIWICAESETDNYLITRREKNRKEGEIKAIMLNEM